MIIMDFHGNGVGKTYDAWPSKQGSDSVGSMLLLPPTSSCHVLIVPSSAAVENLCPQASNSKADMDGIAYGGGTLAAGRTLYVAVAMSLPNCIYHVVYQLNGLFFTVRKPTLLAKCRQQVQISNLGLPGASL